MTSEKRRRVLVISESANFGCARFVKRLKRGGYDVPYLAISSSTDSLHPLRIGQLLNRRWFGLGDKRPNKFFACYDLAPAGHWQS